MSAITAESYAPAATVVVGAVVVGAVVVGVVVVGAVVVGTVTAFTPGQITTTPPSPLVVQSSPDAKPMSYMLGRRVRYVDKDGKAIDPHMIRPGTRVHLDFDRKGAVRRVVVVEKE